MRAVAIGDDRRLIDADLPDPEPGAGEVTVAVAACGICGSDLHLRPSPAVPVGSVMGHEFAGTISALGNGVEGWSVGDRVCVFPFLPCGECALCRAGHPHVCVQAATTGIGLGVRPGGYAEAVAVPAGTLHRLPDEVSDEHGALVEPFAVGLHGVAIADTDPAAPVAVIGAGPIGVMTALALRARGFERIVVIERNDARRARIEGFGFEAVGLDEVHTQVIERLGGELPAAVLECAGNVAAPQLAVELVAPKGRIVLMGVLEEPVSFSQLLLVIKEAELRASFAYRPDEFAEAIELMAAGAVPGDRLVTARAALEDAQAMFDELERPATEHIKVLLTP